MKNVKKLPAEKNADYAYLINMLNAQAAQPAPSIEDQYDALLFFSLCSRQAVHKLTYTKPNPAQTKTLIYR